MSSNETELDVLRDIRELLTVLAEPQLAERDKLRRAALRKVAGKSENNIKAVLLMDGTRNQSAIAKGVPMDQGQVSRLVKGLTEANLLRPGPNPALVIPISESAFKEDK